MHTATVHPPTPRQDRRATVRHDNLVTMTDNQADAPQRPERYLDAGEVGAWFGVSGSVVAQWRHRYEDTPVPDVVVGRTPGWSPDREQEWRAWDLSRPGQGKGGGRPRKNRDSA